ncbi:DUF3105 domain-containing protein [Amycolatopsis alkalitolerans]|uniref:DUF3105 domain-containing protein n=1 Tax=Amycolatopsis alkalitolerans TaxID=2547244 RepID=A0A5C4LV46_9PSEU|nr:DUF3105 domain-containing protein [Amycolatopsis alkalitolerans]TNC22077.1 DUF3105 domain-containing protein [Amycolatopsis alkalitolerans]
MASGTNKKASSKNAVKAARASVVTRRGFPWATVIAVVAVVALAAVVVAYYLVQSAPKRALADWAPTDANHDPSLGLAGIVTGSYKGSVHVLPTERVAYDHSPPIGGPHDGYWAACNGIAYPKAVRSENMVHSLEHGAVWIAYNPDQVTGDALNKLKTKVEGKPYTMLSPYPGLDKPVSLQSWGHQLKVDSADDERIDQFVTALRTNQNTTPEVGASCDALGPGAFDPDNPPPFDPATPGPDAKPMDYQGSDGAQTETGAGMPSTTGTP